jgi:porin
VDLTVHLDLGRLDLLRTSLFVNAQSGRGAGLSETAVGDCQTFSNIDTDSYTQLNEYWIEHAIASERLRFKVGRQDANADFAAVDLGTPFINSSFGVVPTVPIPTFPTPGFGLTALVKASDRLELAAGLFEGAPAKGSSRKLPGRGGNGIFTDLELKLGHKINGLPGTARVGVWYHSAEPEAALTLGPIKSGSSRKCLGAR